VNAGPVSSGVIDSTCSGAGLVNGLFTQSGWLTDGLAVQCK
jgi:hypothetical protein